MTNDLKNCERTYPLLHMKNTIQKILNKIDECYEADRCADAVARFIELYKAEK